MVLPRCGRAACQVTTSRPGAGAANENERPSARRRARILAARPCLASSLTSSARIAAGVGSAATGGCRLWAGPVPGDDTTGGWPPPGAGATGGDGRPATTAVAADATGPLVPPALEANSCTRIACPTSAAVNVYVEAVAPAVATQPSPPGSQASHWWVTLVAFVHAPAATVSICPCTAVPAIAGARVFVGGGTPKVALTPDSVAPTATETRLEPLRLESPL